LVDSLTDVSVTRRLIIFWLIVSTLGYGVAWAFDGHGAELGTHSHVSGTLAQQADDNEAEPACDHCCHLFSHLVGFVPRGLSLTGGPTDRAATDWGSSFASLSTGPPPRPPKS